MSFNKIIVIGNLGRDPELRYTPQGTAVCNFSVATSEKKRDKAGDLQEITTWFRVTTWNKQAENASKYLTKGRPVYVEGRLRIEEWTDRDGKNRYTLEVNATDLQFLGTGSDASHSDSAPDNDYSQANGFQSDSGSPSSMPTDDDIPF
ncbi:MAG TPA: single-stranded DNA-binding protein [Pyrinomonadaceae bacterium]|nr:single-stranded DNA-binding protein [Pyrinomonadaceae bacterium]